MALTTSDCAGLSGVFELDGRTVCFLTHYNLTPLAFRQQCVQVRPSTKTLKSPRR